MNKIKSRGENIYDLDKVFTNYPDMSLTSNNSILIQGQCTSSAQLTKGLFGWIISQTWTKASETIIPTWTFHIFFVMILTLHLENWFKVTLHSFTMATFCAKYEQNWAKERYSITCIRARTLHILWPKALCWWRIG